MTTKPTVDCLWSAAATPGKFSNADMRSCQEKSSEYDDMPGTSMPKSRSCNLLSKENQGVGKCEVRRQKCNQEGEVNKPLTQMDYTSVWIRE